MDAINHGKVHSTISMFEPSLHRCISTLDQRAKLRARVGLIALDVAVVHRQCRVQRTLWASMPYFHLRESHPYAAIHLGTPQ